MNTRIEAARSAEAWQASFETPERIREKAASPKLTGSSAGWEGICQCSLCSLS
jgi:hypothetical protein